MHLVDAFIQRDLHCIEGTDFYFTFINVAEIIYYLSYRSTYIF